MNKDFSGLIRFILPSARTVFHIRPRLLPFKYLPVHYSLFIPLFDVI
jgi:hypothetical protein